MGRTNQAAAGARHEHVFLGESHRDNERRTWMVIALCGAMMVAEIVGGSLFGSLALVADGLHMSTHAGAMLIAALAYTYARRHATDRRFVFGTGKLGDLAGFTSAIVLAMIALLIGYEAVARFFAPVPIHFGEAIPIAVLGLLVNLASVWLLSGGHHGHDHGHAHGHAHEPHGGHHDHHVHDRHDHHQAPAATHRDHNLRAAYFHVIADAAVSVLAIVGLLLARAFGWLWMDPLAGVIGALVIANWSWGLIRDTGGILLDMDPGQRMAENVRHVIEDQGDTVLDLHVWRVGPGHMSAIVSVATREARRDTGFYRSALARFQDLSHLTIEVNAAPAGA
ncbi:CDF family Co(II)/Ni(II) efflux transporter DmeF [Burkholderia gladioli]|uniref:CDF family Co(II)/Ni(II) efflux transporter DmeF n=1 Tax=Burkholderia gladioli TaxID=28095 RepID=UPI000BBD0E2F|nr:CDF family Co(II)/Ni(II) efflux transporter DmeF [Burkholderia gladioli]ATF89750.1 cation transporter [Burkholderia gladioli pv. gladioli]MBJ9714535.1 CDF family Co(II)/Ni(II) efflux transporter DmeF [Burkholderia gladioli]MBU9157842.1 CDF family Co(II)/Ni(II) efflux transporter DmeF [Burkholderia gladioli]MCH7270696.1 CDF family Co(II)/Ni(II) efflux transporter DmeF [Burkholderia gladioli]MDR8092115.1 CDF family Co(II)/Ni(II) efflux transporter DmeF [Burkholderia gladioli]